MKGTENQGLFSQSTKSLKEVIGVDVSSFVLDESDLESNLSLMSIKMERLSTLTILIEDLIK